MDEPIKPPTRLYRLVAIRADASIANVLGHMTWEDAKQALLAVNEAAIFKSVYIRPDTDDDPLPVD